MKKMLTSLLTVLILCVLCVACIPTTLDDEVYTKDFFAMDTLMSITAYGPSAKDAVDSAIDEVTRIENLFSTTIDTSDIAKLNTYKQYVVSAETFALLETSISLHDETNGAFNIAIFPIVKAWGFTSETQHVPKTETLTTLLPHTNIHDIALENSSLRVTLKPQMELGLGGIVKGYTSTRIMDIFKDYGITSGIVNLGGNVQVLGHKPDGSLWNIAIKDPLLSSSYIGFVSTHDKAIITSGPYERNFTENGKTYHHLINPTTGTPAENELASVTIILKDGTRADALTKLFVSGLEEAIRYCNQHKDEVDAILVTKDKRIYITENLKDSFTLQTEDYNLEIIP